MEGNNFNQAVRWVNDPEAARALIDRREWGILSVFINGEATLSEAARRMHMSLPALTYRVKKLLKLGLLEVTRTQQRKGNPVKYYRTPAGHFFVPFAVTPSGTLEDLFRATGEPFEQRLRRELARVFLEEAQDWGVNFYGSDQGGLNFTFSPAPARNDAFLEQSLQANFPAVHDVQLALCLDFDTAKALQRDLHAVYERYRKLHAPGQQPYLLLIGLAPRQ